MGPFERDDAVPTGMAEPYGSLAAFLSDLDEQVQAARIDVAGNEFAIQILTELQNRILGLALLVSLQSKVGPST